MYQASYQLKPGWSQSKSNIWVLSGYHPDTVTHYSQQLNKSLEKIADHTIRMTTSDEQWQQNLIEHLSQGGLFGDKTHIVLHARQKSDLDIIKHPVLQQSQLKHTCLITLQDVSLKAIKWLHKPPHIFAIDCYSPQALQPRQIIQKLAQSQIKVDQKVAEAIFEWQQVKPSAINDIIQYAQNTSATFDLAALEHLQAASATSPISDTIIACLKGSKSAINSLSNLKSDEAHQCFWQCLQFSRHLIQLRMGIAQPFGLMKRPDIDRCCRQITAKKDLKFLYQWHERLLCLEPTLKGHHGPLDHTTALAQIQLWWFNLCSL